MKKYDLNRHLKATCGLPCPVEPPGRFLNWENYLKSHEHAPPPYQSWLEFRLFEYGELKEVPYEPTTIPYYWNKERTYTPDGVYEGNILIEVKGCFWTIDEMLKYIFIQRCNPDKKLIFIFGKVGVRAPRITPELSKKYSGPMTQEDWVKKYRFDYFYEHDEIRKFLEECCDVKTLSD